MVPYKKMDLIVEAFARSGKPLVVLGDGPDRAKIERLPLPMSPCWAASPTLWSPI